MRSLYVQELFLIGLLFATGFCLSKNVPVWPLSILFIGLGQYHLVCLLHECVHNSYSKSKMLNDCVGRVTGGLVLIIFEKYRMEHWGHHRFTATEKDPDFHIYNYQKKLKVLIFLKWFFISGLKEAFIKQSSKGVLSKGKKSATLEVLLIQMIVALGLWFFTGKIYAYLFLWIAPLLLVAFFINRARIIFEHGLGKKHVHGIDLIISPLPKLILYPFYFNYHYSHHKHPQVSAFELPRLSKEMNQHRLNFKDLAHLVLQVGYEQTISPKKQY